MAVEEMEVGWSGSRGGGGGWSGDGEGGWSAVAVEEVEVDGMAVEEVEVDGAAVNEMKADEEELQRPLAAELRRPDPCRSRSQAGRPQSSHRRQITADHKKATSGKSFCPNPTSQAGRKLDRTPG